MDLPVLALRVAICLVLVLGLVWVLARVARRRGFGSGGEAARFSVVSRHALGRNAGVTVVRLGDEALVLGVTEQSVQLLARTDLAAVTPGAEAVTARRLVLPESTQVPAGAPSPAPRPVAAAVPPVRVRLAGPSATGRAGTTGKSGKSSPLAGSALSPATWTTALEALRERTTRR